MMKENPKKNNTRMVGNIRTISETLLWAEDYLAGYNIPDATIEAEYLLAYALNCGIRELYLNFNKAVDSYEFQRFLDFIERRIKREPLIYITHKTLPEGRQEKGDKNEKLER